MLLSEPHCGDEGHLVQSWGMRQTIDGRFEVLETLGTGGMATVYRVRDLRLGVDRALKVLSGTTERDEDVRRRFVNEARTMASVHHPGIVQVHDVGEADGEPYIVMELMPGGSLAGRVLAGGLASEEGVRLVMEGLEGLQAAHDAGIVHRDIKPHNILLRRDGRAAIADFGLARVSTEGQPRTVTGSCFGTPLYMPPEQYEAFSSVDVRSDIYAMGATLYTVLTGRRPHDLYNPTLEEAVFRPVPPALRSVVKRATRHDPKDRYSTAAEMHEALRRALEQHPAEPARPWWPVLVLLAAGAGLAAIGALVSLGVAGALVATRPALVVADAAPAPPPSTPEVVPEREPTPQVLDVEDPPQPKPESPAPPEPAPPSPRPSPLPAPIVVAAPEPVARALDARLFVNSVPAATVWIDGDAQGGTPVEVQLASGTHEVRIRHDARGAVTRTVSVAAGERAVLCWDLEREGPCLRR
ncbi:MAG: serine/threonine protein kinase [Myxococcales bacterium]|nr:serine/threonine protein kinase [Myxococcales bacterium]